MAKLLIANWKMNPASEHEARNLFSFLHKKKFKGVVCPPFVYLEKAAPFKLALGAQDVFYIEKGGPYTGEISIRMLKDLKVKYVIAGHSERRKLGDDDRIVREKLATILKGGLIGIFCVGEPWTVRKKGILAAKKFVGKQLKEGLKRVKFAPRELIVAYEPIWAIGTGKPDSPESANEMAEHIKNSLNVAGTKVIYGGSVSAANAGRLFKQRHIDGALVGGASLKEGEFEKIMKAAGSKKINK